MAVESLPRDVWSEALSVLASRSTDVPPTLKDAFVASVEKGYDWGEQVSMSVVLSLAGSDAMGELAERYREVAGRSRERASRAEVVADAAVLVTRMKSVFIEESTPYRSVDQAYDGISASLTNRFGLAGGDLTQLRGGYHIGAALFAGEAALLEAVSRQDQDARVRRQDVHFRQRDDALTADLDTEHHYQHSKRFERSASSVVLFKNIVIGLGSFAIAIIAVLNLIAGSWGTALLILFVGEPVWFFAADLATGMLGAAFLWAQSRPNR